MSIKQTRVYCAGPLFNEKEREEMAQIAAALEKNGYATFLPQRDGLELTKCVDLLVTNGLSRAEAEAAMSRAVFALDVYQVLCECDCLIANLNGKGPDEGTVSEAAMAWARGRPVVGYKADSRTAFGGQDNPLVAGLFEFKLCQTIDQLVAGVGEGIKLAGDRRLTRAAREEEINIHVRLGDAIWSVLNRSRDITEVVQVIARLSSPEGPTEKGGKGRWSTAASAQER